MSLRPNASTEIHRSKYSCAEEGCRRREDHMVEIRKNKRDESLLKKRCKGLQAQQFSASLQATTVEKKVSSLTLTACGTHDQIKYLVSQGCIKPLCDLLVCRDPRIVTVCFEGLENILKVGESEKNLGNTRDVNIFAQLIDDAEGLEKIEDLQSHDNNEIYEKAVKILETYWLEEEDSVMNSGDGPQPAFNFGAKNEIYEKAVKTCYKQQKSCL